MNQPSKSQSREMTAWEPLETLSPFGLTFGRLFDDFWGRRTGEDGDRLIAPAIDVTEDEHNLTIAAELPGLKKEDVRIQVENGVLSISGEKKFEQETKDKNFHRMERRYGSFYRAVTLPKGVAAESADAEFKDGVLTIRLPKREDVKPKQVKIR
jgi:HSP20 family protein